MFNHSPIRFMEPALFLLVLLGLTFIFFPFAPDPYPLIIMDG